MLMDEFDKYTFIYTNYTLKITKYTNLRRQINRKKCGAENYIKKK